MISNKPLLLALSTQYWSQFLPRTSGIGRLRFFKFAQLILVVERSGVQFNQPSQACHDVAQAHFGLSMGADWQCNGDFLNADATQAKDVETFKEKRVARGLDELENAGVDPIQPVK